MSRRKAWFMIGGLLAVLIAIAIACPAEAASKRNHYWGVTTVADLALITTEKEDRLMVVSDGDFNDANPCEPAAAGSDRVLCAWDGANWIAVGDGRGAAGGGEANIGANLGGGLPNYDSKSGVTLRFNSFSATDFDLAANLLSVDPLKWASQQDLTDHAALPSVHHAPDGVGYDEVQDEGVGLTKRKPLNFIGSGVTCADNPGQSRTDCTFAAGGAPVDSVFGRTGTVVAEQDDYAHSQLASIGSDDHHPRQHALTGADHTVSGETARQVLQATGPTTFGFDWTKIASAPTNCTADYTCSAANDGLACLESSSTLLFVCDGSGPTWRSYETATAATASYVLKVGDTMTGTLGMANQRGVDFRELSGNGTDSILLRAESALSAGQLTVDMAMREDCAANVNGGKLTLVDDGGALLSQMVCADDIGVTAHGDLSGIGSDDHHAKQHALSGTDHTGTLADAQVVASNVTQHEGAITHNNVGGIGPNDHHVPTVNTPQPECLTIADPDDTQDWMFFKALDGALAVTGVGCISADGTSVVLTANECDANGGACTPIEAAITCATTWTTEAGGVDNPSIDADDIVRIDVGTVTGSTQGMICLHFS